MMGFPRLVSLLAGMTLAAAVTGVQAAQRSFVASFGLDTNPCTLTAPCRGFQAAVNVVDPGGEVIALDSAGYGPFTVNKAVQVTAPPGVYAGITVIGTSGTAVTINAGASDMVVLRGLTLKGPGGNVLGSLGIDFQAGLGLHVENCVISGFGSPAIRFGAAGELFVKGTVVRDNNGGGVVVTAPAGTPAVASISHSWLENNGAFEGVLAAANSRVTVRESVVSGNAIRGMRAVGGVAGSAEMNVENCTITGNGEGILSGSTGTDNAIVRVSNNMISHNGTGVRFLNANTLVSGGGNTVQGNTNNGTFSGNYLKQ